MGEGGLQLLLLRSLHHRLPGLGEKKDVFGHSLSADLAGARGAGFGVLLYWLGELGGEFTTLYFSSWLVLIGLCWSHFGWRKLKALRFAFIFMLAMFPLPNFIYNNLSLRLQLISSQLGAAIIHLFGIPVFREGNVINLGVTSLQVVDACSGLRYIMPLVVLGIILAYFFRAPFWKRAVLVISTIPLAIVVNGARIALTGIITTCWGLRFAEGFYHDFTGWIVFMSSFAFLLGEMWLLGTRRKGAEAAEDPGKELKGRGLCQRRAGSSPGRSFSHLPSFDHFAHPWNYVCFGPCSRFPREYADYKALFSIPSQGGELVGDPGANGARAYKGPAF